MLLHDDRDNVAFCVVERPCCIWAPPSTLAELNLLTVDGIHPEFFTVRAANLIGELETKNAPWAAMTLRTDYSHACESVLALLFATLQAPHCVFGWLDLYRNEDLDEMCRRIVSGRTYPHMLIRQPTSWMEVANHVLGNAPETLRHESGSTTTRGELCRGAAAAIEFIAQDFLDPSQRAEYNAFKHGFRIQPTAMSVEVHPKEGAAAIPIMVAESGRFGTQLFRSVKIDKVNFGVASSFVAWNPLQMVGRLQLAAFWMQLLKSHLTIELSDGSIRPAWPFMASYENYVSPWSGGPSLKEFNWLAQVPPKNFPLATKDEVLSLYTKANQSQS